MIRRRPAGVTGGGRRPGPGRFSAGWTILIPGWPQWTWGLRERATVLAGSYAAAMAVGVFAWGTPLGLAVLAFGFAAHAASAVDAIRREAFPRAGRWVPTASAVAGLALCYLPALVAGLLLAWPARPLAGPAAGYAINTWAYLRGQSPRPGDYVWVDGRRAGRPQVARVLAGPGQEVGLKEDRLKVDGVAAPLPPGLRGAGLPDELEFTVPPDHVLVSAGEDPPDRLEADEAESPAVVLVPTEHVVGRAWAQLYPVWNRRLLL